jgi:outer membrane protein TolC
VQLLGLDAATQLRPEGAIDFNEVFLDFESLIDSYAENNLAVQSAKTDIELLENQKRLSQWEEFGPRLSVSSSVRTGLSDPFGTNIVDGSNWVDSFTFRVGVSVTLDGLIPSSKGRVSIEDIEDSIESEKLKYEETRRMVMVDIETSVLNLEKSARELQSLEESVVVAQKVYNLTEMEYNAGVTDLLALEDANDKLLDARFAVLEEKYNYLSYFIDLEYTLNTNINGLL